MFLCLLTGLLLARVCLADGDQLLEMNVGTRQDMARQVGIQAAFLTHKERLKEKIIIKKVETSYYILKDVAEQKDPVHLPH